MGQRAKTNSRSGGNTVAALCGDLGVGAEGFGGRLDSALGKLNAEGCPAERNEQLKKAWEFCQRDAFMSKVVPLQLGFLNHGLSIKIDGKAVPEDERLEWIDDLVLDTWRRRRVQGTVVTVAGGIAENAINLRPELCRAKEVFGRRSVFYRHGYSAKELESIGLKGLPPEIELGDPKRKGERVFVLTDWDEKGFGQPPIMAVAQELTNAGHLKASDQILSFLGRMVVRQHKLGHEVKGGGQFAGRNIHFWKKKWGDDVLAYFKKNIGFNEITSRHDHEIVLAGLVDPKFFDARKYAGLMERLIWWAGPVAFMLGGKTLNPNLMTLLKQECRFEREQVRRHLVQVLAAAKNKKVSAIVIKWKDDCFKDPRLVLDSTKFLAQFGPLSAQTALSTLDFEPEQEEANKASEIKKDPRLFTPVYNPNLGSGAGHKPDNSGGRPAGSPDPK